MTRHTPNRSGQSAVRHRRGGFTLIELLIALLIGALIGVSMVQVLISQNRFMSRESMSREARAAAVGGLGLLGSDLRMVEYSPGNSTGMIAAGSEPNDTAFTVRLPVAFAIACNASTLLVAPYDTTRLTFGGIAARAFDGYAVRNGVNGYTYTTPGASWLTMPGSSSACTSGGGPAISMGGGTGLVLATTSADMSPAPARGTAVMLWVRLRYRIGASTTFTSPQRRALFVSLGASGRERELLAPLDTGARFRYFVAASMDTALTSPPGDVTTIRGIQVVLPGLSPALAQARTDVEASRVVSSIFFRNTP